MSVKPPTGGRAGPCIGNGARREGPTLGPVQGNRLRNAGRPGGPCKPNLPKAFRRMMGGRPSIDEGIFWEFRGSC